MSDINREELIREKNELYREIDVIKNNLDKLYKEKDERKYTVSSIYDKIGTVKYNQKYNSSILKSAKDDKNNRNNEKRRLINYKKEIQNKFNDIKTELDDEYSNLKEVNECIKDLYYRIEVATEKIDSINSQIDTAYENKYYSELDGLKESKKSEIEYRSGLYDELKEHKYHKREISERIGRYKDDSSVLLEKLRDSRLSIEIESDGINLLQSNIDELIGKLSSLNIEYIDLNDQKNIENSRLTEIDTEISEQKKLRQSKYDRINEINDILNRKK